MPSTANLFPHPLVLSTVAAERGPNTYLADRILSPFPTRQRTGTIQRFDPKAEQLRQVDSRRAPGGKTKRIDVDIENEITFICHDHALAMGVADEHRAQSATIMQAYLNQTRVISNRLDLNREVEFINLLDNVSDLTRTNKDWSNVGSATPLADIEAEFASIETEMGVTPNFVAMDVQVLRHIAKTTEYKDQVKSHTMPTVESRARNIAAILGIQDVLVAQIGVTNTAAKGQTTLARIWGERVLIGYREPQIMGPTQAFGAQFIWNTGLSGGGGIVNGRRVRMWRDEDAESDIVKVGHYYHDKVVNPKSARMLTTVLTA